MSTAAVAQVAALSHGQSTEAVIAWAAATLRAMMPAGGVLVDAGCGHGALGAALASHTGRYYGLDVVNYGGVAEGREFHRADLNATPYPLPGELADAAAAVETVEHLENPRALVRELARLVKPGGLVLLTTPNQTSWLSKFSLLLKNQFTAFQEGPGLYPTHITALLPADLLRIGGECGLERCTLRYLERGRMPGSARSYPRWCSRRWPRGASDNVMLLGWRPAAPETQGQP